MFRAIGQFLTTTQFYLYGRNHFTLTGWEKASHMYEKPDILLDPQLNLTSKVFMVTGANAGLGKEITKFLASKGATVYMVCRNKEKADIAKAEILEQTTSKNLHILVGDCGLEKDVRRIWNEFTLHQQQRPQQNLFSAGSCANELQNSNLASESCSSIPRLDALICNAGALLNSKTFTEEGVEVTFGTHLLFGTYLLGKLALPTLASTPGSRLIAVSSGGMYNSNFPPWETASHSSNSPGSTYDGQMAYCYAKRGQVLLCERWAKTFAGQVAIVSCHPGWTGTGGVDAAYGSNKRFLEPLRSLWQGAEGILWLAIADAQKIKSGEFYLDRSPQCKHMAGPFFSEGSFTKNSEQDVDQMMENLEKWSSAKSRIQ